MITGTTQPTPQDSEWSLLVKILEVLNDSGSTSGGFILPYSGSSELEAISTANGVVPIGTIVPVMDLIEEGKLSWVRLISGNSGDYLPVDYNISINNVSWQIVL